MSEPSLPVERTDVALYRVPPTVRWEDATHVCPELEFVVTTVTSASGLTGTGYAYTIGTGGTAILALLEDYLAAMVVGRDAHCVVEIWDELDKQLHRTGAGGTNTLAAASVDMALWDLRARDYGVPLHRLLGGSDRPIPVYGSGIDLHLDQAALLEHVEQLLSLGFSDLKVKIGLEDPAEDVERLRAVRALIGPERRLLVDANQRWTVAQAARHLDRLAGMDLVWIEEPLHAEDLDGHVELRRLTGRPLAIGESLYTMSQFARFLKVDAADVLQPDICRVGGVTPFLRVANMAQAFHRPIAPHYALEATLPLMSVIPNGLILEWVRGGTFTELGLLDQPLRLANGHVRPWEAPGHGIAFNQEKLAEYRVTREQLREMDLRTAK